MEQQQQHHLLVVTYPLQGHINPCRHLAKRLACTTGARVTFSTAVSAHRHMFTGLSSPDQEFDDGHVTYIPYSDGYDDGFKPSTIEEAKDFLAQFRNAASKFLAALLHRFRAQGQPVTCVIFSLFFNWVVDFAHDFGVPSAVYWIQPATVFALYYHYFHGYESLISSHRDDPLFTVHLPALPPFQIRDLPSFLTDNSFIHVLDDFRELFGTLDREVQARGKHPWVLVNSYDALELDGLASVKDLHVVAIGPLLPPSFMGGGKDAKDGEPGGDLFEPDEKKYMEWLDSKPDGSVVYISFGSMSRLKKEQMEEIRRGMSESGRPYLRVVRRDNREEGVELEDDGEKGMVVGWCSQLRVLSHKAVGCFVTHFGWNSTLESLACGVPMIGVPQWSDQATNAALVERAWGAGVRTAVNSEGVVDAAELGRCLDLVMGDGERAAEMRSRAATWRHRALEATREGGSSDRNLKAFLEEIMTVE